MDTDVSIVHPRKLTGAAANLPCNCKQCYTDPTNVTCQYFQWRCPRNVSMQIKCPYPGESEKWFGDELAINVDSKAKHAKAIEFLPGASTWNVCVLTWYPAQLVVWLLLNQRTILTDGSLSLIVPIGMLYTACARSVVTIHISI